jgi:hypothetical protein
MWSEEFFILGLVALYPFLVVCFLFSFLYNLSSLLMKKTKIEVGVSPTGPVKKRNFSNIRCGSVRKINSERWQFNLVQGFKCHRGSTIIRNSSNKKVRLGVMTVSPTEERVLEGLSNPFFVQGHDRPARQSNLRP